jgi:hypothetical protein
MAALTARLDADAVKTNNIIATMALIATIIAKSVIAIF